MKSFLDTFFFEATVNIKVFVLFLAFCHRGQNKNSDINLCCGGMELAHSSVPAIIPVEQ